MEKEGETNPKDRMQIGRCCPETLSVASRCWSSTSTGQDLPGGDAEGVEAVRHVPSEKARLCCRVGHQEQLSASTSILLGLGTIWWFGLPQTWGAGLVNRGLRCFRGGWAKLLSCPYRFGLCVLLNIL